MLNTTIPLNTKQIGELKEKLKVFAMQFDKFMLLDTNLDATDKYTNFKWIFAIGCHKFIISESVGGNFELLNKFYSENKTDIFGFLGYDLKNEIELLSSNNDDKLGFPDMFFFIPEISIWATETYVEIKSIKPFDIEKLPLPEFQPANSISGTINHKISRKTYADKVDELLKNIHLGNIYEANFCMEFFAENIQCNPSKLYNALSEATNAPFGVFLKLNDKYLLSASPERYLKKSGSKIISQPMKGTAKRSANRHEDLNLRENLANNLKERAENIMICDLVRNDLSKIAKRGSVKVEELCKVYSYPTVHQMISTISCEVESGISVSEILKSCFPPGSMTGAPKIRAMQLIEEQENTKRGLYSGSVGYITETGDFDFNVVIRSLQFNQTNHYLSYMTGSAITSLSDINEEYNECLLKAQTFFNLIKPSK